MRLSSSFLKKRMQLRYGRANGTPIEIVPIASDDLDEKHDKIFHCNHDIWKTFFRPLFLTISICLICLSFFRDVPYIAVLGYSSLFLISHFISTYTTYFVIFDKSDKIINTVIFFGNVIYKKSISEAKINFFSVSESSLDENELTYTLFFNTESKIDNLLSSFKNTTASIEAVRLLVETLYKEKKIKILYFPLPNELRKNYASTQLFPYEWHLVQQDS